MRVSWWSKRRASAPKWHINDNRPMASDIAMNDLHVIKCLAALRGVIIIFGLEFGDGVQKQGRMSGSLGWWQHPRGL